MIVMVTWGSFGDLHPYMAVARGLRQRGHAVTLATCEIYRTKVESEGFCFAPYPPDVAELLGDPPALRRSYDLYTGTEYVIRAVVLPRLEEAWRALLPVCAKASLIVGHPLAYAAPLVAEHLGIPWLSVALQPAAMLSAFDPPYFPRARWLYALRHLGHQPFAALFALGKRRAVAWGRPVLDLRRKLGLRDPAASPLLEGSFSPYGTMAWFSSILGEPQPDWPRCTRITGFPFYDRLEPGKGLPEPLARFLDSGSPPLVFTLGSSASLEAGSFYQESVEAARALGQRAVLLTGLEGRNHLPPLPETIIAADYAPFSELFPRASAIVHQGGIGTTAQALRSGRPMLVVPYSHDQPDNAQRVMRAGCGRMLTRNRYTAGRAAAQLDALLQDRTCGERAAAAGKRIAAEDGVAAACDFIAGAAR